MSPCDCISTEPAKPKKTIFLRVDIKFDPAITDIKTALETAHSLCKAMDEIDGSVTSIETNIGNDW